VFGSWIVTSPRTQLLLLHFSDPCTSSHLPPLNTGYATPTINTMHNCPVCTIVIAALQKAVLYQYVARRIRIDSVGVWCATRVVDGDVADQPIHTGGRAENRETCERAAERERERVKEH
jgi:hypothetical protein